MIKYTITSSFSALKLVDDPEIESKVLQSLFDQVTNAGYDIKKGTLTRFEDHNNDTITIQWTENNVTSSNERIFVIAGTTDQAREWIKNHYVESKGATVLLDYVIVSNPQTLRGYKDPTGVFTGTWYERKDALDILSLIDISLTDKDKKRKLSKIIDAYYERKGVG